MADDGKIIPFPTDKIVNPRTRELDEQRRKMGEKVARQIQEQQTKKFVETAVDDISMHLLKKNSLRVPSKFLSRQKSRV